jgi:hypothetical protein
VDKNLLLLTSGYLEDSRQGNSSVYKIGSVFVIMWKGGIAIFNLNQ